MVEENEQSSGEPARKQAKLVENSTVSAHGKLKDLSGFKLTDVLQNNTKAKTIFLRGKFEAEEGEALVILEKTAFCGENFTQESDYFSQKSALEKVFQNDVYADYKYFPVQELNSVKTTIVHPATEKHISKYSIQNLYMLNETPEIYNKFTLPHLNTDKFDLQWVYNILEHKSETDRILVEDSDPVNGFVVVPDLKWAGEIDTLYFLALCNQRGIKSIRDLTGEHLPLLKNIRDKTVAALTSKYGLDSSQLRIYFHYQPSFYHLHVHFTYLRHEAPGILAERAHMLTSVISNLELLPDYYQRATIPYVLRENDKLFAKLEKEGLLKKKENV
ncbi:m7GpppX diphosphatase [Anthonomus grandis grandis]|uniref:m7GpppX diphosphatase n=1 Tax=Anthonomus grandis grandis TaxID=2921223 RepID=UPI0021653F20|nr:m7GpppX diphosphatase [Anthonomus grandis grandis]